jgi:hypothetical protein
MTANTDDWPLTTDVTGSSLRLLHHTVSDVNDAVRVLGDVVLVGYERDRVALTACPSSGQNRRQVFMEACLRQ